MRGALRFGCRVHTASILSTVQSSGSPSHKPRLARGRGPGSWLAPLRLAVPPPEAQATRNDDIPVEGASPARLLEMLSDRFGAFEAIAYSTIKFARHVSEDELSMDVFVAEAVLEFRDDPPHGCRDVQRMPQCREPLGNQIPDVDD